jgi:hypothetical protein
MGRICGAGFDELVIYEMDDRRGQPPGSTASILLRGALQGRPAPSEAGAGSGLDVVLDVRQAIRAALHQAGPGDLIVVGCASHLSDFKTALGASAEVALLDAATFGHTDEVAGHAGASDVVPREAATA